MADKPATRAESQDGERGDVEGYPLMVDVGEFCRGRLCSSPRGWTATRLCRFMRMTVSLWAWVKRRVANHRLEVVVEVVELPR